MEYKLSDLFTLQMGKTPARDEPEYWQNGSHSWISIADLSSADKYIEETKESISDCAVKESNIGKIPEGTVVMSFKLSLGKVAITKKAMYSNEAIMAFIPRAGVDISTDYLYYLLKARRWDTGANKAVKGITLNKATLSSVKVCIHSPEEQRQIVNILDKLKSVIKRRRAQLAKLEELVKCRFVEMFGDMRVNTRGWENKTLGEACDVRDGTHDSPKYHTQGYPLVTSKNVTQGIIDFTDCNLICEEDYVKISKRSKVDKGDIIMPMIGTVGCPVIVETDVPFAIKNVALIKFPDKAFLLNVFVKHLLLSSYFETEVMDKVRGGTQKFISLSDIRKLRIFIPPVELQNTFADFVHRIDKLRIVIRQSLDEAQKLFDSLMQEYFD